MRVEVNVWNGFTQEEDLSKQLEVVKQRYLDQFETPIDIELSLAQSSLLESGGYELKLDGVLAESGKLQEERFLALKNEHDDREFEGDHTSDPVFGLPAVWVDRGVKEALEGNERYTVVNHFTVVATHLSVLLKIRV